MKYDNPCCRGDYTFNAIDPRVVELLEHVQKELPSGGGGRVEFLLAVLLQPDMAEKRDWIFGLQYAVMGASDANVPVVIDTNIDHEALCAATMEDIREIRKTVNRLRKKDDKRAKFDARMAKQRQEARFPGFPQKRPLQ